MDQPKLEPCKAPTEWHSYLYRAILLEWETNLVKHQFQKFNQRDVFSGISLYKKSTTQEMEQAWGLSHELKEASSYLVFHDTRSAFKSLFKLLRNCVAHGHYTQSGRTKIYFHHNHKNQLKLFGELQFSQLLAMVDQLTKTPQ